MRASFLSIAVLFVVSVAMYGDAVGGVSLPDGESALVNGCFNAEGAKLSGWRLRSGELGKFEMTEAQEGSPSPVLTISVKTPDPKPWMMELHQSVKRRVEKGTAMYITFEYKMTKGYSFQFYWQLERAPWPKLLSMHLMSPENEWHRVRVWAPVHETYQPDMTAFSFHLAEAKGILQLRDMYAVIVPSGFNPEDFEVTETAVLGGDFYDRVWRSEVKDRLRENRCLPLDIRVFKGSPRGGASTKNLPPAGHAVVLLKQMSRPFQLGATVRAGMVFPKCLAHAKYSELRKRLSAAKVAVPQDYFGRILQNGDFSVVHVNDLMGWRDTLDWGDEPAENLVERVGAAGKKLVAGSLYVPSFDAFEPKLRTMDRTSANEALQQWIGAQTGKYAGRVAGWCVLHDVIASSEVYDYIGVDSLPQAFLSARKGDEAAKLLLSDSRALTELSEVPLQDFMEFASWIQTTMTASIDGFVLDAGMTRLDVAPQTMEARLNALSGRCPNVPIHIVNLAVNMPRETFQADMLKDYMTLFYAQRQVKSVSLGELWSPAATLPSMGYLKDDFSPKKSMTMVRELLNKEWLGDAELKTDGEGLVQCELFGGEYQVDVVCEDRKTSFTLHIPEGMREAVSQQWELETEQFQAMAVPPRPKDPKPPKDKDMGKGMDASKEIRAALYIYLKP